MEKKERRSGRRRGKESRGRIRAMRCERGSRALVMEYVGYIMK